MKGIQELMYMRLISNPLSLWSTRSLLESIAVDDAQGSIVSRLPVVVTSSIDPSSDDDDDRFSGEVIDPFAEYVSLQWC